MVMRGLDVRQQPGFVVEYPPQLLYSHNLLIAVIRSLLQIYVCMTY